jgi:hypothetical protein
MFAPYYERIPCALCAIVLLVQYAIRFRQEWREYHPKQEVESSAGISVVTHRKPVPPFTEQPDFV